jgi:hypothetical protein
MNNSPCGIEFHAGAQSNIPTQIRFSLRGHHLVLPLSRLILQYHTNLFCGYVKIKIYEIHVDNIDDLSRRIRESVEQFPKDMLQCFMTFLPPILQDCIEQYCRHLQIAKINKDFHIMECIYHVNIFFPLCLEVLYFLQNRQMSLAQLVQ